VQPPEQVQAPQRQPLSPALVLVQEPAQLSLAQALVRLQGQVQVQQQP
jgi:hypothetical protein